MRVKVVAPVSAVVLMCAASSNALLSQDPPRGVSEVSTTATVTRSVKPDLATVTFSFVAIGPSPSVAGRHLASRADSLRRSLSSLGIPRYSLVSGSRWYWWRGRIDVQPRQQCIPKKERTAYGPQCDMVTDTLYTAHDAIEVGLRDLTRVGAVIDTAMAFGITEIGGVRFEATDVLGTLEDMLREATQQARRRAEAMASASDSGRRTGDRLTGATTGRAVCGQRSVPI